MSKYVNMRNITIKPLKYIKHTFCPKNCIKTNAYLASKILHRLSKNREYVNPRNVPSNIDFRFYVTFVHGHHQVVISSVLCVDGTGAGVRDLLSSAYGDGEQGDRAPRLNHPGGLHGREWLADRRPSFISRESGGGGGFTAENSRLVDSRKMSTTGLADGRHAPVRSSQKRKTQADYGWTFSKSSCFRRTADKPVSCGFRKNVQTINILIGITYLLLNMYIERFVIIAGHSTTKS